jgi:hypothetical protein
VRWLFTKSEKTFNRGFTDCGLTGKLSSVASIDTPKSIGEYVGVVARVEESSLCSKALICITRMESVSSTARETSMGRS